MASVVRPVTVDQLEFWVTDAWDAREEEVGGSRGVVRQPGETTPNEHERSVMMHAGRGPARAHLSSGSVPANAIIVRTVSDRPRRFRMLIKGFDRMLDPLGIGPRMETTRRIVRRSPSEAIAADWALVWLDLAHAFTRLVPSSAQKRNGSAGRRAPVA
jgi:hypothetical protein